MDSNEASPTSNHDSTPTSPNHEGSTYGTPGAGDHPDTSSPPAMKGNEKDPQLVVGAGRSLKNMLVDLMGVLETQAKAQVFIQGDITLRVEGRETYTISLFNAEGLEPSDLKVSIDKSSNKSSGPSFPNGISIGEMSRKRARDDADAIDLIDDAEVSSKRTKVVAGDEEPQLPATTCDNDKDARSSSEPPTVMSRLQNVSAQIKWVEECRRIADEAHDRREETWRGTSATFHDETRRARERHEAWMVSEMSWQRNILVGMMNDLKGLYPLGHSLKWETPPQMPPLSGPPVPMPSQPSYQSPYNVSKRQIPKTGNSSKPK